MKTQKQITKDYQISREKAPTVTFELTIYEFVADDDQKDGV